MTSPHGLILLPRSSDDPSPDRVERAAQLALKTGWTVGVFDDAQPEANWRPELDGLKARGIGAIRLMQCYPRPTLETELLSLASYGDPVCCVLTCRQFGWTAEELAESHRIVNNWIEERDEASGQYENVRFKSVLYFGWDKAPQWLRDHLDAYCRATPAPDLSWLPRTIAPAPPVLPPPPVVTPTQPPVIPGPVDPGHQKRTKRFRPS